MEVRTCPACGGGAAQALVAKDYNRRISDARFVYYRCGSCATLFLANVPDDLGRYYATDYYEIPRDRSERAAIAFKLQGWKLDLVQRHAKHGRLLEIGPAYGLFAYLAKEAGFDVTVIEQDARCCDFLRETVGVTVIETNTPRDALPSLEKFDVIVLWQVIEHLTDAYAMLDLLAERLAPGGVLIFDTPNPKAFQFKVTGRRWVHLDAPRHVVLLPASTVRERLEREGLTEVLLTAADRGANGFNGWGWAFTLRNLFTSRPVATIAHFAGRVLGKLLIPIERTGFRGSTYTAVFRKGYNL